MRCSERRRAAHRAKQSGRSRRPAQRDSVVGRDSQQGARHRGGSEPARGSRKRVAGDRGPTLSQSHQLQGRILLPQRQHEARVERCGTGTVSSEKARAALGRCARTLVHGKKLQR